MQTFLPYSDFDESARCLDSKRLGKQRVECKQICLTLYGASLGWRHHPITRMWSGHIDALCDYWWAITREWLRRGYRDVLRYEIDGFRAGEPYPAWLGDERLHLSHRSNLVRKFPEHYRPLWPDVPDDLEYFYVRGD